MLHNVWIAKDTGECLFHKKYGSIEQDENLITSFLSAIEIFAQNIDKGCNFLQTSSYKFIYISGEQTVTVACVDCEDDEDVIRPELAKVEKEFYHRFSNDLKEWRGRVEGFADLSDYCDEHLKKYSSPLKEFAESKLELNPIVTKENLKSKLSPQQDKVISLLKYKGAATLNDIVKLMKLSETDAEKAAKGLLYNDIIRQIPSS